MKLTVTRITHRNRAGRVLWSIVYAFLYRPSPIPLHGWRRFLLRCFGARIGADAMLYPSARIWAPWNLTMGKESCLGRDVDCYSVAPITLGDRCIVSQYTYLCSASHDYTDPGFPLAVAPIVLGAYSWVAAGAFIGPGITVGDGAVVGARSVVTKDVPAWAVVAGHPARFIKDRPIQGYSSVKAAGSGAAD